MTEPQISKPDTGEFMRRLHERLKASASVKSGLPDKPRFTDEARAAMAVLPVIEKLLAAVN